ncbi:hypothetical protein Tco_0652914 [Tanacetum coccineum]|uniref:Uncharacterized protein n=1 Tax=Tanacetum coccineum TaxID=301880 RepID=A0ABQ4WZD6_9ASTR
MEKSDTKPSVDKKKVIITETSIRRDLQLADENGTECLPNATIFAELERMGAKTTAWNEFSSTNLEGGVKFIMYPRFVQVFLDKQVQGMSKHKKIYVTPSHTKKVFANMKRQGKDFSGRDTPLFPTMIVQAQEQEGEDSVMPIVSQPSDSTEPIVDKAPSDKNVTTHSNDPLVSGEDRLKLNELMELCTNLSQRVLDLENIKTSQAAEITKLNEMVKKLERRNKSRTPKLKRLRKVGRTARIESSEDEGVLDEQEVKVEKVVSTAEVTTASATTTTVDELTLAQTLIEIKAAKPKAVTTAATTTTIVVSIPKARGVTKARQNVEPEKPLKKKDQILIDEEIAQRLQEELQAELEEEERLARQKEEDANIAEWDNVQAMIDADYELAARLQAQEQEELTIEERSKMFVELMDKRKKHFARLRAEEQRRKPPTKAQKRSQMSTYLKHMAGYKQNQMKSKNYDEIQKLFDKAMTRVNMFVDMDTELVKESSKKAEMAQESSSKRAGDELEQEKAKKQKIDDDEAYMKKHMETVPNDEVAIDAIPLATKPPIIVDWKIIKERKMGHFQIIRPDGSLRRYSSMIKMLLSIDREDLETLWKLVKAKHRNTRPEEGYERVL